MKKSQGEIFGIALLFVVLIIGILVYAKIQSIKDVRETDLEQEGKYKIIAESSLNSIIKMSTSCEVERDKDTLKDLVNYCIENEYGGNDPQIYCDDIGEVRACKHAINIINKTAHKLFLTNNTNNASLVHVPFDLRVDLLSNRDTLFSNLSINNFNEYKYKDRAVNESNRRKLGFKRAPSGPFDWSTAQRNIRFELYLYYK